jgi:hypothetical protein
MTCQFRHSICQHLSSGLAASREDNLPLLPTICLTRDLDAASNVYTLKHRACWPEQSSGVE